MSSDFQHQENARGLNFSKPAPTPQHGKKPDREVLKREETRPFAPKPPHL
jgi:hypothetical protein